MRALSAKTRVLRTRLGEALPKIEDFVKRIYYIIIHCCIALSYSGTRTHLHPPPSPKAGGVHPPRCAADALPMDDYWGELTFPGGELTLREGSEDVSLTPFCETLCDLAAPANLVVHEVSTQTEPPEETDAPENLEATSQGCGSAGMTAPNSPLRPSPAIWSDLGHFSRRALAVHSCST